MEQELNSLFVTWAFVFISWGVTASVILYRPPFLSSWPQVLVTIWIVVTVIMVTCMQLVFVRHIPEALRTFENLEMLIIDTQLKGWTLTGLPVLVLQVIKVIKQIRYINHRKNGDALHS